MKSADLNALWERLTSLRSLISPWFGPDTAVPGTQSNIPSAGHCAAVAAIVNAELGGVLISANVDGQSHWFNRFVVGVDAFDADLTGDQFGQAPVQLAPKGHLHPNERLRSRDQLNAETIERALMLAERAGLTSAACSLAAELHLRHGATAPTFSRTLSGPS